jgi:hypothetical protein
MVSVVTDGGAVAIEMGVQLETVEGNKPQIKVILIGLIQFSGKDPLSATMI